MSRSQIWSDSASAWVDMQGHGGYEGTWLDALFNRPSDETVHVDDQEFTGTIGGTAVTPTGTAVWTQGKGLMSATFDDQANADVCARLYSLTPTSAPVTIETAVNIAGVQDNYSIAGIVLTDGTATSSNVSEVNLTLTGLHAGGLDLLRAITDHGTLTNIATWPGSITFSEYSVLRGRIYLRLIWSATDTFKGYCSIDGVTWAEVGSSWSDTLTPTHFGVSVSTFGGTNPSMATWEYLRVTESDLSV